MRYLVGFLLLLCSFAATAQKATVAFLPDNWFQVQVRAGQENRSVFLYIWSPSCGPCVEMARDVFPDTTVAHYYNATFLSYKVNLDEGAGKELGTRYGITSLPAYLYFDSKCKLLHRSGGGKPAAEFIQDGKDAFDPSKAFFTLRERYKAGDRTAAFLYAFSAAPGLAQESDLHDQVVRDYLKTQNAVELTSRKNLEYLFNQYAEFNSPATQYFLAHQPAFAAQFGQEAVTKRTRGIISQKAEATGRKKRLVRACSPAADHYPLAAHRGRAVASPCPDSLLLGPAGAKLACIRQCHPGLRPEICCSRQLHAIRSGGVPNRFCQ